MINKKEIDQKSKEFEIHSSNVERDYVFSWLLNGIFTQSKLKDEIFLKGGNALRKGYFGETRFSKDLDFGIPNDISQESLLSEINNICDYVQSKTSVTFSKNDNKVEEKFSKLETPLPDLKVYEVKVYFKDFYGEESKLTLKVGMDLTRFDKVLLPIQTVQLIHPYSDSDELACNIRCMKLEEIIATKLKCLLQRQHTPDLFDYAYSIKLMGGNLNTKEVTDTLIKKTIFSKNPHMLKDILIKTSFDYFRNYWDKTIICAQKTMFGVEDAINTFVEGVNQAFQIFPDNGYRDFAFFAPDLRVPIMKAGRDQTMLKIRYNGADRLVEPYSLKYQQKKDGSEREYFYVYNVNGGDSPPGVRCFVAQNVQLIENTDQKFVPRDGYPIELCKAGELPENHLLFDPNKPARRQRFGVFQRRRSFGVKYIYKCPVCGKKFTRNTMDGSLNPHKNKNGYTCYGSYGSYIETRY